MEIRSIKNSRVKEWKKLGTKKGRTKAGQYMVEGFHLVEEAITHQAPIETLVVSETIEMGDVFNVPEEKIIWVSEEVSAHLAETKTTQGIFAVIQLPQEKEQADITGPYLFLDGVQDPGNVGTMIRTADAAGFSGVVLGRGSADLYNGKTLRSAQGSHFHIDVRDGELEEWIQLFQSKEFPVFGTALDEKAQPHYGVALKGPFALIMGSEGQGVRPEILSETDKNLYIPIKGQAESLNVAVAAGILMFQLKR